MAAPAYKTEAVAVPAAEYADTVNDLLADAIDSAAEGYQTPAKFRTDVYAILSAAETLNVDQLAMQIAWKRLERVLLAIEHFSRPEVTLDVLRCIGRMNEGQGLFLSDYARQHKITPQAFYHRMQSVCRFLDVPFEPRKTHGVRRGK